jgi:hypothetical protein
MAVTFKCLASGQTVTFVHQVDIDSMKGHSGYEEVKQEQEQEATKEVLNKKPSKKQAATEVPSEE